MGGILIHPEVLAIILAYTAVLIVIAIYPRKTKTRKLTIPS
ncbi:MAG: hypothetical protein ABSC20_08575 [Candidatus Bathyarchaeia archaeon]|jgi:hypothetical protein